MKIHTHWLRVIHKWIGLLIGLQLLMWTLSGAMMALLDMHEVSGGDERDPAAVQMARVDRWPVVRQQLGSQPLLGLSLRPMLDRQVYEVSTPAGVRLFDAASGVPVAVTGQLAKQVAAAAYPGKPAIRRVAPLTELTLAVRDHSLPIWQVDFADEKNSTYYVSGSTGELLERRNDTWRLWDFFWMLHIMDYDNRSSFNHPLIITLGFAAVWLAITGLWLLFRTGWRSDFKKLKRRRA
jgi:uncharacterized iron-regulated membrane protein